MSIRIVIAGDSFLSFMVARQLNRKIGNLAHISLKYLTGSDSVVYPHQNTVFGKLETIDKRTALKNTRVVVDQIKSVNFNTQTITAVSGVEDYDFLILDRQPGYHESFWRELRAQMATLLAQLSAQQNIGQTKEAQITVTGHSLESYQLALAIKRDLLSHRQPNVIVRLQDVHPELKEFLTASGIVSKVSVPEVKLPGLTVAPAKHLISGDVIKGAKLAHDGSVMVDVNWLYGNPPRQVVIAPTLGETQNMISVASLTAHKISGNILNLVNDKPLKPEGYQTEPAIFIQGVYDAYLQLGTWKSRRFRSQFTALTEKFAWENLQKFYS